MELKNYRFTLTSLLFFLFSFSIINQSFSQMDWNRAGNFSGTDSSYVAVSNSTTINITGSFSLEAWIYPFDNTGSVQTIISKGSSMYYGLRLSNTGKAEVYTNSVRRLASKTVVPKNKWTHISAVYSSASNNYFMYINGVPDTSSFVGGSVPTSNADSLFIGNGSNSTPFKGYLDEVRIWNRNLSAAEVNDNYRTTLGSGGGAYASLMMSITFQSFTNSNSPFSLSDKSPNGNNGFNRGITAYNLSDLPSSTISLNQAAAFDGNNDYLSAANNADISPVSAITLEAWIYIRAYSNCILINKGPDPGASSYRLAVVSTKITANINGTSVFTANSPVPLGTWTHVAFTYNAANGHYNLYTNGIKTDSGTNALGPIIANTDSLYIGGNIAFIDFNGYMDEVRIFSYERSEAQINSTMYKSLNNSNFTIMGGTSGVAVYNLDGSSESSINSTPRLYFRNNAVFSSPATTSGKPVSPPGRAEDLDFQSGFYLKSSNNRIPQAGTSGLMSEDTLIVILDESITDINLFISLNHFSKDDLDIYLIAPNGDMLDVCTDLPSAGTDISMTTVFDDQADSSVANVSRYVSYSPRLKPENSLNALFSGDNTKGAWRLIIADDTPGDTGRLYAWGLQFNNASVKQHLLLTNVLIEGFYNDVTNQSVRDTVRYYMRKNTSPFALQDSAKLYIPLNGTSLLSFANVSDATDYYIQLVHRNSITTWSSDAFSFDPLTSQADYRFNTSAGQAYYSNMTQVDSIPIRYGIFSGDVNQNKYVDLADVTLTYNDAASFVTGYKVTDVNGDNISDLFDLLIVYNNSTAFVQAYEP